MANVDSGFRSVESGREGKHSRMALCDRILVKRLKKLHKAVQSSGIVTRQELQEHYETIRARDESDTDENEVRQEADMMIVGRGERGEAAGNNNINHLNNALNHCSLNRISFVFGLSIILIIFIATPLVNGIFEYFLSMRCFVPNNYLIWEAVRHVSDCNFCRGIDQPLVLPNVTKDGFAKYAYSSRPIIIKKAIAHWPAVTLLNYTFLKDLYLRVPGALDSVFHMTEARANHRPGEVPWYVGWSNCHPVVLAELRKLYPRPHFLPDDAEMPNTDFVFLGYEQGAIMHLDYIPRLMWQAQLQGQKHWKLAPTPECESQCQSFGFSVEPGDAVLVDTRLWYHGTYITTGEFSLTIQSEYG